MLAQAGLADRAGDQVSQLSAGNRQRVNIASGLVAEPPVLLLDEPSASLDPRQRGVCGNSSVARRAWHGVVYSTHIVEEAEQYADRVLVLADGGRCIWGTLAELRSASRGRGALEDAFVSFLRSSAGRLPRSRR